MKFVSPVPPGSRVSSPYGARIDPVTKKPGAHHSGLDWAVPIGTPLVAPTSGKVVFAGPLASDPAAGIALGVNADDGRHFWSFSHLSEVLVKLGARVEQGAVVARSGNTGTRTTGPHLHFSVKVDGKRVDPMSVLGSGAAALVALAVVAKVALS